MTSHKKIGTKYYLDPNSPIPYDLGFGTSYLGYEIQSGQKVWIVVSSKQRFQKSQKFQQRFQRETNILSTLKHPAIIKLIDQEESYQNYYTILESCDGNLNEMLNVNKNFGENNALQFIQQILDVQAYFEQNNLIFLNFSSNCLYYKDGQIKLTGFGSSQVLYKNEQQLFQQLKFNSILAPELIQQEPQYNNKTDIWSLGVLLYEMITGNNLFSAINCNQFLQQLSELDTILQKQLKNVPEISKKIIKGCLKQDMTSRYDYQKLKQILKQSILKDNKNLIKSLNISNQQETISTDNSSNSQMLLKDSQNKMYSSNQNILQKISMFTVDEDDQEQQSLMLSQSDLICWAGFSHQIQIYKFFQQTMSKFNFIPNKLDTKVPLFCLNKYLVVDMNNILQDLEQNVNVLKVQQPEQYFKSDVCQQQKQALQNKLQECYQNLCQTRSDIENQMVNYQTAEQKIFYRNEYENIKFEAIKPHFRQPIFNLVQKLREQSDERISKYDEKQRLRLIKIAHRLVYCMLVNRLFPLYYKKKTYFSFEKFYKNLQNLTIKDYQQEVKKLVKQYFGV